MGVSIQLLDGRTLSQDRVIARRIRSIMEFSIKAEQLDENGNSKMSELEIITGLIKLVLEIFPKEKNLENYLWDNYTFDELFDFCNNVIDQAMGGTSDDIPSQQTPEIVQ